ncbi:hypothetical protein HPP92_009178 [Vanilla planifolia]|uniref:Uncharacterized protein n=1 Tax=Vanilla planifolia TaxID=51239 RepID=A0A835RA49_VANPL|nr:hypothetical protein HPP92_009178 [Vanilla planifolia]
MRGCGNGNSAVDWKVVDGFLVEIRTHKWPTRQVSSCSSSLVLVGFRRCDRSGSFADEFVLEFTVVCVIRALEVD